MDPDLMLFIGIVLALLATPSIVDSFSEARWPYFSSPLFALGVGLIVWAWISNPAGYRIIELPRTIVEVVARYIL